MTKSRRKSRKREALQEKITEHIPKVKRMSPYDDDDKENVVNHTNSDSCEPLLSTNFKSSIAHQTASSKSLNTSQTMSVQSGSLALAPQHSNCNIAGSINYNIMYGDNTKNAENHHRETTVTPLLFSDAAPLNKNGLEKEGYCGLQIQLKCHLKEKYKNISEGIPKPGSSTLLSHVYTDLHITEGDGKGVNDEHELLHIESSSRKLTSTDSSINCNNIFRPLGQVRAVLTKGIAGIGKTVSVQKFILDWTEEKANQDIDFIFTFPFRELNAIQKREFSVTTLIYHFYPLMKKAEKIEYENLKIMLIFDGMDECRCPLNFHNESWFDVTKELPLDVLLTNLIKGNLLPNALLWITTRPAAANQIPPEFVDRVTEIQGFNDAQKEEYFRKKIKNQNLADRIITHIKSTKSLYIMCHIPIFCWISAYVLEKMLAKQDNSVPKTLTEMYSWFVLIQTNIKNKKYYGSNEMDLSKLSQEDITIIMNLGKLAFQQLEKGNFIFYKEDLDACGVDDREASVHSGVCTAVFKEEVLLSHTKVYCFVHLTVQEYLAAFYVFRLFSTKKFIELKRVLKIKSDSLHSLHKAAVDKALQSKNGQFDLFLRFLFGISLDSNKDILQGLLPSTTSSSESIKETIQYVKVLENKELSPERCINLIHCLVELRDSSLMEEVKECMSHSNKPLTPAQSSALAYVLMTSEMVLDAFDVTKYKTSQEGRRRLIPVIKHCKKSLLPHCNPSVTSCNTIASALGSPASHLIDLDLSHNSLGVRGLKSLCTGLKSPHCKLLILNLSFNKLTPSGAKLLCSVLMSPHCKLEVLDLSNTDLGDSGLNVLCEGLAGPQCKLQTLRLSGCQITERGCASLTSALRSNPSHMKELDLRYNHPGDPGVKMLSAVLEDPRCKLKKLDMEHDSKVWCHLGFYKYACQLTLDLNTAHVNLSLCKRNKTVLWENMVQLYPDHPERFDRCKQVLCSNGLTTRSYWEVKLNGNDTKVGVTYRGIGRKGEGDDVNLGSNNKSWTLSFTGKKCSAHHNNVSSDVMVPSSSPLKIGVYLDWTAGTLSFYRVSSSLLTHLHTFQSKFTEPLYPAFGLCTLNGSVSLC